ncbi:autotransporter assembly complex protein TamA [Stutzerimonas nitrititolerans]|uniref:Translocation and assembly module subunit TamA n=1 Tax=Stutzerimonas nitrititolerans TaxID=2482751 RepID=A0AA42BER7_9GAMM|nr:autotransporter assembly complex family protein [Stutzerimonas nitrititolerans]MBA1235849.1 outer membrane protein assembly factor [Stutzerimonas stutzeri]MCO7546671.1 autotransporter assembly complex protein TamA [Stutzerimonas nitrititolerans]WAD28625.1 autotransporter assembly complex protein TamA [Pseudomonadaceae bacterium T75]
MCISNRRGVALAGLLLVSATELAAAELDVRIEPGNRTLRENIENHIGDLGDRDERELLRYSRIAREQAQKALQALGYYNAVIDSEVIAGEPPRLSLRVKPGPPVRLRTVRVRVEGSAAELKSFQNPQGALEPGTTLNHGRYEEIKQRIANQASRFGFFEGRFTRQRLAVDPRENFADIELVFESGPRYHLGEVSFEGDAPFDADLLERMVPFEPGTPYDSEWVAELSQALQSSGYFDGVRVDANPANASDQRIPVSVLLTTREPRTLGLGLGFSTDVGPRIRLDWTRHWVNPQGHSYGAEAELSAPRQNVGLWYDVPLDPPLTDKLRYAGGYQYEELGDNDSLSRLLTVGPEWHRRLDNGWKRVWSLKWQHEEYRLGDDSGVSTLLMPGIAYSLLRSDNRIDPNRGYRMEFELAGAKQGLMSDADLIHANAMLKGLGTLFERHRFLGSVQLGANITDEYTQVPPSLRYFAGGDQSVRGYDYQSLSPTNSDGDRIGGRYQFAVSAEYQYSLTEKWRVATFMDQGNAFNSADFPSLKSSVGVGVRWVSPVGPIRLDLAHPLDGDGGVRLHFSMGPEL